VGSSVTGCKQAGEKTESVVTVAAGRYQGESPAGHSAGGRAANRYGFCVAVWFDELFVVVVVVSFIFR
jgi:hypothetical protein